MSLREKLATALHRCTLFLLCVSAANHALAHELPPGYLELTERADQHYAMVWKLPLTDTGAPPAITPEFLPACSTASTPQVQRGPGAIITTSEIVCPSGLAGAKLTIKGLEAWTTDILFRFHHADGRVEIQVLKPQSPTIQLAADATDRSMRAYLRLGLDHIALGIDHLLFVLGLLLIVRERSMLLKTVTAFTLSHSVTLAVATLGWAQVPAAPLNATIALSILFLGPEIVRTWRNKTSFTIRHPWVVAFGFGLLHGFGFASGLTSLGVPPRDIVMALLWFNVGVEVGQIAFILLVFMLLASWRTLKVAWPWWALRLPGYAVGSLGAFWSIERILFLTKGVL